MPHVAVVGSCNIDLVAYAARLPGPGETVLGERFEQGFGGKGANQAVMAARLGPAVSFVGALGDDDYAARTLRNFEAEGIDTAAIQRVAGSSGVAPIWVEPDGTNRIIVIAGANGAVDPDAAATAVATMPAPDVVVGQLEIPQRATLAAFRAARARGAVTVLNPAPAAALDPALIALSDWLVPNEVELEAIAGRPGSEGDDAGLAELAARLGVGLVVTLGAAGAAIVTGGVTRLAAPTVAVVDTTGAGDAFVGAFAAGLATRLSPVEAARLGIACAAESVTRPGTQASYPNARRAAELRARIAGGGR